MEFSLESILGSVDPEAIVKSAKEMISSAFPPGKEMSEEEFVKARHQQRLGEHMKFVGENIQSWDQQLAAINFCSGKLDDPPPGYPNHVLGPTYQYVIRTSHDPELIDCAIYGLATLHLKGQFFDVSVEERYKLPTEQTVAIADMLMEQVSNDKVYEQWTRLIREPWMKRRERRAS